MKGKNFEITAKNILVHEMIGLKVKVIKSTDAGRIGLSGVVVNETQNTFVIQSAEVEFIIPKKECEFEFDLEDEKVNVNGNDCLKRPEERLRNVKIKG
ncbi:MAG: ribonuclease P protein component 1 [archaeon]